MCPERIVLSVLLAEEKNKVKILIHIVVLPVVVAVAVDVVVDVTVVFCIVFIAIQKFIFLRKSWLD